MAKMRAAQITGPNGPVEIVEREIPEPGDGEVRIRVEACGVCHSDSFTKEGTLPGIQYPRIPGHEVAGTIDAIGTGVAAWTVGQRVGVGWHGGHCGYCDSCRHGDFVTCQIAPQVTGISYDGGYAEYMIAPAGALALIPEGLSAVDAGPLMCAGVTTFNPLRSSGARGPAIWWRYSGSAGLAIWVSNSRQRWVSRRLPSLGVGTRKRSRENLARTITSIANRRMLRRTWPKWAAPKSFWQR
jgi:D-arabinose 1-dehydrogenase-like Zn-dependent alcohol dehydrogenase